MLGGYVNARSNRRSDHYDPFTAKPVRDVKANGAEELRTVRATCQNHRVFVPAGRVARA